MERSILVENISFSFVQRSHGIHTFKDAIQQLGRKKSFQQNSILDNISFEINKGECFAIMGKNGCGKSTLLRIISGIIEPKKGNVKVKGSIAPLLALGVGLEPELSGYENIRISALITGIPKKKIQQTIETVKSFSELSDDDLKMQVKRYSSGMTARLAFSIALANEADILIIDEVLAVGDEGFQNKCYQKIDELKQQGKTIILVSHSVGDVERICDRGIVLDHGKIICNDSIDKVVESYHQLFR